MYRMDYHHHSCHSFDSTANMEDICVHAIQNDIEEICFTEHFSVNQLAPTYGHMDFAKYTEDIQYCREKYGHSLSIKMGLELCEPHRMRETYKQTLEPLDLDFILGSVHNVNNQKLRLLLKENGINAYKLYFEELYRLVATADIDVMAHFDLMKRYAFKEYGLYSFEEFEELIRETLKKAIDRNIGIEINTSGLRSSLNQTLPFRSILELYKELGGEILTIGSDSHKAETVGSHLEEAYALAKDCGFHTIYRFEKRKPIPVEI
ncbi:histidinol-phosphatase HisJ family protein [Bacillus rubiinfantis]|uniref:histidinol-phosphatase HisJ family protein n=1 Tax=Bacillus rubiinfantis TaxID=1499680 RepID=UPI0005A8DE57|nr:histidinol-phosphatase HisJ family protein [Bacillus rubiinfantis]